MPSYIILSMRIAIGADHAGFTLKEHLRETLTKLGHQVKDFGTHSDASVDYPPICAAFDVVCMCSGKNTAPALFNSRRKPGEIF